MTRAEAIRRLQKLYGNRVCYRVGKEVSSVERRAAARSAHRQLQEQRDVVTREINERLAACDWYQALLAKRKAIDEQMRGADRGHYFKFIVGHSELGMFMIQGEGDTWEEAIDQAARKKGAK